MPVASMIKSWATGVLPWEPRLRITNECKARSAFSPERWEVLFDQAALLV